MNKTVIFLIAVLSGFVFQGCGSGGQSSPTDERVLTVPIIEEPYVETPVVSVKQTTGSAANTEPVLLVVDGFFRSTCPSTLLIDVESSGRNHRISAKLFGQNLEPQSCATALQPFQRTISLGELAPGRHVIQYLTFEGLKEWAIEVN